MMSRAQTKRDAARSGGGPVGLAAAAMATMLVVGCGSEPEAEVVRRPKAAPAPRVAAPPPAPAVTPVDQLMAQLSIDERIVLAEDKAPDNDVDRKAVLEFFDAFARGDVDSLGTMMSMLDGHELNALAKTEVWDDTIAGISEIELTTGRGPFEEKCVLAIFTVGIDFQPQLWYYTTKDDEIRFDAVATPPDVMNKLSGSDWILAWHELLEEERMLANKLDVDVDQAQVILAQRGGPGSARPSAPSRPTAPGFSPGGPGRSPDRRPPGKKRKPPGSR